MAFCAEVSVIVGLVCAGRSCHLKFVNFAPHADFKFTQRPSDSGFAFPFSVELTIRELVKFDETWCEWPCRPDAIFVPDHGGDRDWTAWWQSIQTAQRSCGITHVPHLIAQSEVEAGLDTVSLQSALVVRGDRQPALSDGVSWLRRIHERFPRAHLSVAAYPEKHPLAESLERDVDVLFRKFDVGAKDAITQFCFHASGLEKFIERIEARGLSRARIRPGFRLPPAGDENCFGVRVPKDLQGSSLAVREAALEQLLRAALEIWGADFRPHFFVMQDGASWRRVLRAWTSS